MRILLKKVVSLILILPVIFITASADSEYQRMNIVTEYISPDLMSDIKDEEAILTASDGNLQLNAKSAILIEMNSGKVLFEKDADVKMPPASITKVMTLLLVMEAIEAKKFDYNTEVTC